MSVFLAIMTAILATVVTVSVALGGHVYGWELIVWAWVAVSYALRLAVED